MLLSDKAKIWLLATLKANSTVASLTGETVESWGEEVPSRPGVFVGMISDSPAALKNVATARIRVVAKGEGNCAALCNAVINELRFVAGRPRAFSVPPREKDLDLAQLIRNATIVPERDGVGANLWAATLQYQVRGRHVDEAA